jgi:hypothetical protein
MDFLLKNTINIVKNSGVWTAKPDWTGESAMQKAFAPFLPEEPVSRDIGRDLVTALEMICSNDLKLAPTLAVVCFELKRLSGTSHREIGEVVHSATKEAYSISYISRLINAGSLLAEFPYLVDLPDNTTRLTILRGIPADQRHEIFDKGLVAGVCIRTSTRAVLTAAVASLNNKSNSDGDPIQEGDRLDHYGKELRGVVMSLSRFIRTAIKEEQPEMIDGLSDLMSETQKFIDRICSFLDYMDAH